MESKDDLTAVASNVSSATWMSGNDIINGLELDLAERVQQLLLPKSSPVCTWCCIGVKNRMAAGLGGDYYDPRLQKGRPPPRKQSEKTPPMPRK
jgi:phosphoserine phosphatase RsbU/P